MELTSEQGEKDLDSLLRAACPPPPLPVGFRARLQARMVDEGAEAVRRAALELDWQRTQQQLRAESVQLRWQTLLWLIGGAFAAGALTMAAMPWVALHFGPRWTIWVPIAVAMIGLLASWVGDPRVRRVMAGINFPGS